tara:strand:- start:22886 stop:23635 length:750 start_codon:yes stop_codon:yes gene_type:complete
MLKIKIPSKKKLRSIQNYFERYKLFNHLKKDRNTYAPDLNDLYYIHQFILLNKRTTVLEFGCGWSTVVMKNALDINKKKYLARIKKLRKKNFFELFTLDNQRKYLSITKNKCKKILGKKSKINFFYSENKMTTFNGRICSEYTKLPKINPDFIYLDGPDPTSTKGNIKGFNTNHLELMPMSCDILKIEHFLLPGTIILSDGRTANVRFLKSNFQRNWIHIDDTVNDQHILYLDEKSLGKINDKILNFYK